MLGSELMSLLYKGYSVPKSQGNGRYVDMGMSFKKGDAEEKHSMKTRRPKRKAGELMEIVFNKVTDKWQSPRLMANHIDAAVESIRNSLNKLAEQGRVECNNIPGMLQYRKKR